MERCHNTHVPDSTAASNPFMKHHYRAMPHKEIRRIIFVNRYFYPDICATSQILSDLAPRLVAEGFDVHVVCSRQLYDDAKAPLPHHEVIDGINVHRIWTTRFGRHELLGRAVDYASFAAVAAVKLFALTRDTDVLVSKTDPPLMSIVTAVIAALRRARLVNWLQDIFPEIASRLGSNPLPLWMDSIVRRMRSMSLRSARANIVLGERMRANLLQLKIPAEQICIIENWADGGAIVPLPAHSTELRKSLNASGNFVVGYSGNLGRAHEYDTLLDAALALRGEPDIVFMMSGGGAKMQQLKIAVQKSRLGNFLFLPYQTREGLGPSLAAADVHLACLLPALEGLVVPSKFYGILAAGRPVIFIGDPDGELARVIRSSGCGSVVATGDGASLVAEIRRLKTQPDMLRTTGERSRRLFDDHYTLDIAVGKWVAMLRGLTTS